MAADQAVRQLPRGRHGLTREQVATSQHSRMLEAMADAVSEKGYVNTSVADVIRRAGVSRETFYQQFADKQACFLAAYDAAAEWTLTAMTEALGEPADSPVIRFDRALSAYLDTLRQEPALARTFLIEVYAAGPAALMRRTELQGRFAGLIAHVFNARSERDRFACETLVAAISSLVTTRIGAESFADLSGLHSPLMDLVRRALNG